jgi:hypothetical protein
MYPETFFVATGQWSLPSLLSTTSSTNTNAPHYMNQAEKSCSTDDEALCRARKIELRKRRLQFIQVLLGILVKAGETEMYQQAKSIVSTCVAAQRRRDPRVISFSLPSTVELLLRDVVGSLYWRRAEIYMQCYLSQRVLQSQLLRLEDQRRQCEQMTLVAKQTPLERLLSGGYEDL